MFRFENLEIWKRAIEIADELFDIADQLESQKLFRFAEQLRDAALSMPNNIAEGSGSQSNKEFSRFLNYARRSAFENANMLIIFARREYITSNRKNDLFVKLDELCRMITSFQKRL